MALTLTRHNGRSGKNGVYNPKHNDRSFDVGKSEHIDEERAKGNVYWDCMQGLHIPGFDQEYASFEDVEKEFYHLFYLEATQAQNERNIKNRHPERNRTPEDLLRDKRTCPEETIYQIGSMEETVPPKVLAEITAVFFSELDKRFGEHFHILDWSLHLDEATPHIHERHVFDCEDSHGFRFPQQEKALEKMGIELPDPSKPKGKNNNRKMTFDKMCRELFFEICENHALYLQREPTSGGRAYMEKQDYIIAQQKKKLVLTDYLWLLRDNEKNHAPHSMEDQVWHPLFCEAPNRKGFIEYVLDELLAVGSSGHEELRHAFGKEVERVEKRLERHAA